MVLRLYGQEGLQSYIRNHISLAKRFEELVRQDSRFEVIIYSNHRIVEHNAVIKLLGMSAL